MVLLFVVCLVANSVVYILYPVVVGFAQILLPLKLEDKNKKPEEGLGLTHLIRLLMLG